MNRRVVTIFAIFLLTTPLAVSLAAGSPDDSFANDLQIIPVGQSSEVPLEESISWSTFIP